MIRLDYDNAACFLEPGSVEAAAKEAFTARKTLLEGTGKGSEFTGWIDLPENFDRDEYAAIKKAAEKIRRDSDVLVVIGIGGSYLGAKAAIEILNHSFFNALPKDLRRGPQVLFCGNNISARYFKDLTDMLQGKDWSINVISKSGTTTEPAIAFRILKKMLTERYGKEGAAERIYATTDRSKGALRTLADRDGYETFVVPDDVGGRYSVLTAVGLLPIAVSGVDTDRLLEGACAARREAVAEPFENNTAMKYAALRNCLFRSGKTVEILADYEPSLHYIGEWWKQLYGESEGKDHQGLFPACADFTTDLHSFGQFIQDGTRIMFETVISIDHQEEEITVDYDEDNLDGLNYLAGRNMSYINKAAMEGSLRAHVDGAVPNMRITLDRLDAYTLGELFYMFEFACGVSGYMLGVNPFDQPGVESYKRNMFEILGKPGYQKKQEA